MSVSSCTSGCRGVKNYDSDLSRLYPNPDAKQLVEEIAKYHGVSDEQVFVGVGSDDVIGMAFLTFLILTSQYYFRILHIPFMMCGRIVRIPYKTIS